MLDAQPPRESGHPVAELVVAALERIPAFSSLAGRALLIEVLRERHGAFSLREQLTSRLFFVELVRWCARTPGAPADLADAVRWLAPGEPAGDEVQRVVHLLAQPVAEPVAGPDLRSHGPRPQLPQRVRALLIGCATFERPDSRLLPLPAVRENLVQLSRVLRDPAVLGLRDDQITVIHDPPDADAVLTPLVEAASAEVDLLLVYYAGHGILADGELRLAVRGTTSATASWTGLDGRLLRKEVHRALATTRLLIVDCCYSGRLATAMTDPGSVIEAQLDVAGAVTIASSAGDAVSYSPQGEPLTAFTRELVTALRDGLPGDDDVLTVDRVFAAVRARLHGRGLSEPRMLHSDRAARTPIARNRRRDG